MAITLRQFEQIDGLRNAMLRDAAPVSHITGQPIRPLLNEAQHEARLFDAVIDLIGFDAAQDVPSIVDYVDGLLTDCLAGRVDVVDAEAA